MARPVRGRCLDRARRSDGSTSATAGAGTMSTPRRAAAAVVTLALGAVLLCVSASPAAAYDFPSTNDANRAASLPHVDLVSTGPGSVTLEFVNTRNTNAFF